MYDYTKGGKHTQESSYPAWDMMRNKYSSRLSKNGYRVGIKAKVNARPRDIGVPKRK